MLNMSLQLCDVLLLSPFTVFTLPSCPALCCSTAVRSRGAVRLIRARVQQEIRWAFVMSCVSHTNSRAQGWGSSVQDCYSRGHKDAETKESWDTLFHWVKWSFALHRFYVIHILPLCSLSDFTIIDFSFSHACCIIISGAPVACGFFASLVLWFYLSKRITLASITLCHHHHWCCCWDISLCLNPSCVIKVPLCISSPSLSENLSCPLMGVCWWVLLIVGYGLRCHLYLQ